MTTGGKLNLEEGTGGGTMVGFKAPDTEVVVDVIWTLPSADGTQGQVLATDGAGTLGWVATDITDGSITSAKLAGNFASRILTLLDPAQNLISTGSFMQTWAAPFGAAFISPYTDNITAIYAHSRGNSTGTVDIEVWSADADYNGVTKLLTMTKADTDFNDSLQRFELTSPIAVTKDLNYIVNNLY